MRSIKNAIYRTNPFVTVEGNGRGRTNVYIKSSGIDVGADIFRRGLCLPSDNKMTPEQARRHEVRPGFTGLAQVNGRNAISWEEKFDWDVKYVDHITFAGDVRREPSAKNKVGLLMNLSEDIDGKPKATMVQYVLRKTICETMDECLVLTEVT